MHLPQGTILQNGKYKIVRFIKSGGFGCTYEGQQTLMGARVAIKELFVSDFCNREDDNTVNVGTKSKVNDFQKIKKSFIKEAALLYQMQNPHIVRVTDVFEENGTAYYIMDYIDGSSLSDIVDSKGKLSEEEALGYIRQVCEALKYVHGQNRLHLDIKPGNIMVDKNGKAILIDFGTSKYYNEETGEQTSTLLGFLTKPYAPVEQINGSFRTFNPSADIYSLGATLYKLLTGITPTSALDILSRREELKPLPASISEPTRKAVEAAMQLFNDKRPQSIEEFERILNAKSPFQGSERTSLDNSSFNNPSSSQAVKNGVANSELTAIEDDIEDTVLDNSGATVLDNRGFQTNRNQSRPYTSNQTPSRPNITNSPSTNSNPTHPNTSNQTYPSTNPSRPNTANSNTANSTYPNPSRPNINNSNTSNSNSYRPSPSRAEERNGVSTPRNSDISDRNVYPRGNAQIKPTSQPSNNTKPQASTPIRAYNPATANYPNKSRSSNKIILIVLIAAFSVLIASFFIFRGCDRDEYRYDSRGYSEEWIDDEETTEVETKEYFANGFINGYEYVDLGLPSGLKWAAYNLGAKYKDGYGAYFSWGETNPKEYYSEAKSETFNKSYQWLLDNDYIGEDGNLTLEHDAARQKWGGSWRMPTIAEFNELINNTTSVYTSINGVNGRLITSKYNDESIFLPASGWYFDDYGSSVGKDGAYWSSTPYSVDDSWYGSSFSFSSEDILVGDTCHRGGGFPIRPVSD